MNRNTQVDVVKGIAIISVVLGHSCYFSIEFVYMYHLVLFFFVAGWTYNEKKYSRNVNALFAARMKSIMPMYVFYSLVHLLLRNLLINLELYSPETPVLTINDFWVYMTATTYFASSEWIGSAFWFIPVLIVSVLLFGSVMALSNIFYKQYQFWVRIIGISLLGIAGVLLIQCSVIISFHLENAFLVVPVIGAGYLYQKYNSSIDKHLNLAIAVLCLLIILAVPRIFGTYIELSIDRIINPFIFYLSSLAGIIFWVYVSGQLVKRKVLCRLFSVCGKYSLDIMALHILVIKIIDFIWLEYINPAAGIKYAFVYSVKGLWSLYLIGGAFVPILIRIGLNKLCIAGRNVLRRHHIILTDSESAI